MKTYHLLQNGFTSLFLLACFACSLAAQQPAQPDSTALADSAGASNGLRLLAKYTGQSVLLRWAPTDPARWLHGNTHGYRIERAALDREGYFDPAAFIPLTAEPVRLGTQEAFKTFYAGGKHPYVAVAAQAAFGRSATAPPGLIDQVAELQSRWGFALLAADFSPEAARALGLRFEDNTAEPGKIYAYRIRFATPDSVRGFPDADYFFIRTDAVLPAIPPRLLPPGENDGSVTLFWEREWHEQLFSGYFIERSADSRTFERLNETPYTLPISDSYAYFGQDAFAYADSLEKNYASYYYRLVGINAFGELSPPSAAVRAMGRDRTPPGPPEQVHAQYLGNRKMEISWEKAVVEADLAGFHVARSADVDSRYQPITSQLLPPGTRRFVDKNADEDASNFYMVVAVDTAGNGSVSLYTYGHVVDTLPPAPPEGLRGAIDSNGVVRVSWNLGKERDLKGYTVHFSNAADHELSCLTPAVLLDTLFIDTIPLNTLTEKIYYRVVAVDLRGNHSAFSELLELHKPDTLPPASPLFTDYRIADGRLHLQWTPSGSEDVQRYVLLRRPAGGKTWQAVFSTPRAGGALQCTDSLLSPGQSYEYWIAAEDDAGLRSRPLAFLPVKIPDFKLKPAVQNLTLQLTENKKGVVLRWSYPYSGNYRLVLYRAVDGDGFATYTSFQASDKAEYTDHNVRSGQAYEYTMKAFYADGKESAFSPVARVALE